MNTRQKRFSTLCGMLENHMKKYNCSLYIDLYSTNRQQHKEEKLN